MSPVPRFLPTWLGGEADRCDGEGVRLPVAPVGPGHTTDPADPTLGRGVDDTPIPQHDKYLVLSEEERAKGFVRPVRRAYVHTVCGSVTTMSQVLAETYARQPTFYGATYCVTCEMHKPVGEFVWDGDGSTVGS